MIPIWKLSDSDLRQILEDGKCALKTEPSARIRDVIADRMREAETELKSRADKVAAQ